VVRLDDALRYGVHGRATEQLGVQLVVRRFLAAATTAVLGVAVNLATDNLKSPTAWAFVAVAVIVVTLATGSADAGTSDKAKIKGKRNVVVQQGKRIAKAAKIRGDSNRVTQSDR
jgi:hypothetical protein